PAYQRVGEPRLGMGDPDQRGADDAPPHASTRRALKVRIRARAGPGAQARGRAVSVFSTSERSAAAPNGLARYPEAPAPIAAARLTSEAKPVTTSDGVGLGVV